MGKRRCALVKSSNCSVDKFGLDVFCKFKAGVRCVGLVDGQRVCFVDETSKVQFELSYQLQFGFCPYFPEAEKVEFMASIREEGFSVFKRFR